MSAEKNRVINFKIVLGVFIILAGLIALLNNFGFNTGISFWDFWPLILIIIGLGRLLQPAEYRNVFAGLLLLVVGVLFQLSVLDIIYIRFSQFWPVILILVGAAIIRQAFWPGCKPDSIESNVINFTAVMGGGEYNFSSQTLVGGNATMIMGGGTINLANAEMQGDSLVIDIFALMGGVDIVIPQHWSVIFTGFPVMGGMSDKTLQSIQRNSPTDSSITGSKKLIIKGIVIMGGVEIKN